MAGSEYYRSPRPAPSPYRNCDSQTSLVSDHPPYARTYIQPSWSGYSDSHTPSQSYHSYSASGPSTADPYRDSDSIPLNGRSRKDGSRQTVEPMLERGEDDTFIRDVDLSKRKRRRRPPQPPPEDGWFTGQITWVVYVLTVIQLIVFVAEIVKNGILTGSPIEIHPSFNPMIGPSPYIMINMGARYQPCMHNMPDVQNATTIISWPCPNATATTGSSVSCSLSELCGFLGVPNPHPGGSLLTSPPPNQWWRFIVPIFIHAGIIHIGFNLLLQLTLGRDIEKLIGSIRFAVVYFASGVFGFVLGGNFAATGIASCGCSGSLFGILAITLLDLFYTWKQRTGPIKDLLFILIDVIIAFVLGLLPGLDNFSHIGGFLMGLVLGISILRSPTSISKRTEPAPSARPQDEGFKAFIHQPITFFRNRRLVWWVWSVLRVVSLLGAFICFILLIKNFYVWNMSCGWCKYLSCLPVTVNGENWCKVGNLDFTPTNTTAPGNNKRALMDLMAAVALIA